MKCNIELKFSNYAAYNQIYTNLVNNSGLLNKIQTIYADSFGNFGWIAEGIGEAARKVDSVVMKFKRDRKIRNKSELTRLQRQFEACTTEIVSLDKSKVTRAAAIAYVVDVTGCAFMAGSVFTVTAGNIPLCVFWQCRDSLGG